MCIVETWIWEVKSSLNTDEIDDKHERVTEVMKCNTKMWIIHTHGLMLHNLSMWMASLSNTNTNQED